MKEATLIQMMKDNKALAGEVTALTGKVDAQERLIRGSMLVMQDYDHQLNAMKDLLFEGKTIDETTYNVQADKRRGLRLIDKGEKIAAGDIAWVRYTATAVIEGAVQTIAEDNELPVRVGSGAVNFEQALVNKTIGDEVQSTTTVQDEGPLKGQDITFNITVLKAKTKIKEETTDAGATTDGERATDGHDSVGADNGTPIEVRGRANQEHSHSPSPTL
jgi:FKBP-type peptidyl-prolyl cis-trans isomerase 2